MLSYTTRSVYFWSLLITCILYISIFCIAHISYSFLESYSPLEILCKKVQEKEKQESLHNIAKPIECEEKHNQPSLTTLDSAISMAKQSNNMWELYIPSIQLVAPIEEGTTTEVMNRAVGHFENSNVLDGNICLAAHNRGYPVNYFQHIKNLQKGDLIVYKTAEEIRVYAVERIQVIKDTDWTNLQRTEDNRLTLITCVENEPDYRRCIQALQIK